MINELNENKTFYRRKWLREHRFILVLAGIGIVAWFLITLLTQRFVLTAFTPIFVAVAHAIRNNAMMAYIEKHIY